MSDKFKPGDAVTYKCGSPTFVVLNYKGTSQVLISWFNPKIHHHEQFAVPEDAIETVEDFNERKLRIETRFNDRVYQIPSGLPKEQIITIGFDSADHRNDFMKRIFEENAGGHVFDEDAPVTKN